MLPEGCERVVNTDFVSLFLMNFCKKEIFWLARADRLWLLIMFSWFIFTL